MIFHIAFRADWEAARDTGRYEVSTRDLTLAEQGYIHCSRAAQVGGVLAAFYADVDPDDLVLLAIDPARLDVPLRDEAPEPGGEEYPHLYGPLPVHAVVQELRLARDPAGRPIPPPD